MSKISKLRAKENRLRSIATRTEVQEKELAEVTKLLASMVMQQPVMQAGSSSYRQKRRKKGARRVNGLNGSYNQPVQIPRVLNAESYTAALSDMRRMGNTKAGQAWALKACHPPSNPEGFQGITDFSTSSRNSPEFRTTFDISYDKTMFAGPIATPSPTYSVQIMCPDIPEIAFMYRIRDDASATWSLIRVVRTSTFDTPAANSAGLSFPPGSVSMLGQGYSRYRCAANSMTTQLLAPGLADQGMVYVGQITPQMRHVQETISIPNTAAAANRATEAVDVYEVEYPPDEKNLVQSCPSYYKSVAKDGAFAVSKFNESLLAPLFHPCGSDEWGLAGTTGAQVIAPLTALVVKIGIGEDDSTNTIGFTKDSTWSVPSGDTSAISLLDPPFGHPSVSEPSGMASIVMFYIGISNAAGTSAASVSVVVNQALDAYVPYNSALAIYSHEPPEWDEVSIRFVAKLHQAMRDGLPACANGFMDWIRSAFSWLKGSGKPVIDVIKSLPIPGMALAGPIADAVIEAGSQI